MTIQNKTSVDNKVKIGLALSGGGSRAIAFHLGCLRALNDRGILDRVNVISTVSGGSVIGAIYAYSNDPFEIFEEKILTLLKNGLTTGIIKNIFWSKETPKIFLSLISCGLYQIITTILAIPFQLLRFIFGNAPLINKLISFLTYPPVRFASRTTAFKNYLHKEFFSKKTIDQIARSNLELIINAAELRTETALRYGSKSSGNWRFGTLTGQTHVSKAVAASAAFPAILPAFDEYQSFKKSGVTTKKRIIITDGGIYDNLGLNCLLPGRNPRFETHINEIDFIIACVAGNGLPNASVIPYFWGSRMLSTLNTIHRRTHSLSFSILHKLEANKEITGFIMPYLGQQDETIICKPAGLIERSKVADYPTDFSKMDIADINNISLRGEQLTRHLLETRHPNL